MNKVENTEFTKDKKQDVFELPFFADPPSEYRPVVFWSWNEIMEPDEVRRQLRLMKKAGLGGGFIHSRVGLLTDYLGDEWFQAVQATIDESKQQGFKVYLYDEDKWPSGFAGGLVPLENEAFRMKALIARPSDKVISDEYTPIGSSLSDIQVYRWVSPLGYDWFNGTCYTDLMSREAMLFFIEQSYQTYYDRFSEYYGNDIILEFTDEPCTIFRGRLPEGAVPYSDDLSEAFRKLHGYEPEEHLHKLFLDVENAEKFRIHYFRTVNYLFENNFSKQISDWCTSHNIGLTGHYMLETEMYGQQLWGTKVMANYRHQHQPGVDLLGRQIDEIIAAKQCQSGVNQSGKKRMLSELFGCSGQGVSFEDRLWIATQQIQLGVNFLNPHLSLYTMSGCRKRDFPPNLFYQQPWWEANQAIDIPLSRLCYAMSCGTFASDVLVIHPQESTFALWQSRYQNCNDVLKSNNLVWDTEPTTKASKEKIDSLDKSFKELMLTLLDHQIQYDLGDETLIADDGSVELAGGKPLFKVGRMSYSTVILPSMYTMSQDTLCLLKAFQKNGGKIYCCGEGPFVLDGLKSEELDEFLKTLSSYDLAAPNDILEESKPVHISRKEGSEHYLWTHLRNLGNNSKLMMVSNLTRSEAFEGQLSLEGVYQGVWLLDHWTGEKESVSFTESNGKTVVNLTLEPVESKVLIFDTVTDSGTGILLGQPKTETTIELEPDDFGVMRLGDNALVLDRAKWSQGDGALSEKPLPLTVLQEMLNEKHYAGKLTLEYNFDIKGLSKGRVAKLVLEHPEYYQIFVNGAECQYAGLEPWLDIRFMPIDITGKLVEGANTVRLECIDFKYGDKNCIEDMFARYGTEIEAVYIVGDFAVDAEFTEPVYDSSYWQQWGLEPELLALKDGSAELTDPKPLQMNNLTRTGLPFYAGKLEYSVELPEISLGKGQGVCVSCEKLNAACAEIFVDNDKVGYITARPYQLDISKYYRSGRKLRIILYSTLRNLLGPHHHTDGEVIFNSPLSFLPEKRANESYSDIAADWLEGKMNDKCWNEDYCLLNFGYLGKISVAISGP